VEEEYSTRAALRRPDERWVTLSWEEGSRLEAYLVREEEVPGGASSWYRHTRRGGRVGLAVSMRPSPWQEVATYF